MTAVIQSTTISGQKALIEPYPANQPCYTKPKLGISVFNVQQMTIGGGGLNQIRDFEDTYSCMGLTNPVSGLAAVNSNVTVSNTMFLNITSPSSSGRGIIFRSAPSSPSKLTLTGLGQGGTPTFENMQFGIDGLGRMEIKECDFNIMFNAIFLTGLTMPSTVLIENNSFRNMLDHTINSEINGVIRKLDIRSNDFFDDDITPPPVPLSRAAIRLFSANPAQQETFIFDNMFNNEQKPATVQSPYEGVSIRNLSGTLIEANNFTDGNGNVNVKYEGVHSINASTRLWDNDFTGAGNFNNHPSTAIFIDESPSSWLNCNTADQTEIGIEVEGMNSDNARIEASNLNTHDNSLLFRFDAITGIQTNRQNEWIGAGSNTEALFEGRDPAIPNDLFFVQQSRFLVRHQDPSNFWPDPRLIGTTPDQNQWFRTQTGKIGYVLCVRTPQAPEGDEVLLLTEADQRVLNGTYQSVKGYPAGEWEAGIRLFMRLDDHANNLVSGSPEAIWYANAQSTPQGQLGSVYKGLLNLGNLTEQEITALESAETDLDNIAAAITAIDQAIANTTDPTAIAQLLSDRSTQGALLSTAIQTYSNLSSTIINGQQAVASNLLGQVNSVVTSQQYEMDFKNVCRILLDTYLNDGEMLAADQQALEGIAHQCRYAGGLATLQARASLDAEWDFDAYDNCPDYFNNPPSQLIGQNGNAGLYPNPARHGATLSIQTSYEKGIVQLRDLNGRLVESWDIEGSPRVRLDWGSSLAPGLYFLSIHTDTETPQTIKLTIVK